MLQSLAIYHLSSGNSKNSIKNKVEFVQSLQQSSLKKDLRKQSCTWYLLPFSFNSLFDSPAQMMHEVSWKINSLISSQEIQHQFVVQTRLVRTSSLLKEAVIDKFQKHPILFIHVHQLSCWISFQ